MRQQQVDHQVDGCQQTNDDQAFHAYNGSSEPQGTFKTSV
jgi:hypothetical protein